MMRYSVRVKKSGVCGHVTFSLYKRDIWKVGSAKTLSLSCNILINVFTLTLIYWWNLPKLRYFLI